MYMPGSMLISLNDKTTMSTEVTLIRESGGVDLGKFKDVYEVYKLVTHGIYTPEKGTEDLDDLMQKRGRHSLLLRIFAYGIAAIAVGPFAFSARPVDFGPSFILGCSLGFLQLVVVKRSEQFSHVFEVLAAVLISFTSRGLGSIYHKGTPVFCFSAIAQSSIALILPGYTVLCAALELQSKSLVSGSVRMVYAIIYSLFLGFGILVGSVVMGRHPCPFHTCEATNIDTRPHLPPSPKRRNMPHPFLVERLGPRRTPPLRALPVGSHLRNLPFHHQSSEVEANAHHDPHRLRRLSGKLLDLHETVQQHSGFECYWRLRHRHHGEPVLALLSRSGGRSHAPRHLRASPERIGSKWQPGRGHHIRRPDHGQRNRCQRDQQRHRRVLRCTERHHERGLLQRHHLQRWVWHGTGCNWN